MIHKTHQTTATAFAHYRGPRDGRTGKGIGSRSVAVANIAGVSATRTINWDPALSDTANYSGAVELAALAAAHKVYPEAWLSAGPAVETDAGWSCPIWLHTEEAPPVTLRDALAGLVAECRRRNLPTYEGDAVLFLGALLCMDEGMTAAEAVIEAYYDGDAEVAESGRESVLDELRALVADTEPTLELLSPDSHRYADRLEKLREKLREERISMAELAELAGMVEHIHPGDVELLEAAGVPEFPDSEGAENLSPDDPRMKACLRRQAWMAR